VKVYQGIEPDSITGMEKQTSALPAGKSDVYNSSETEIHFLNW